MAKKITGAHYHKADFVAQICPEEKGKRVEWYITIDDNIVENKNGSTKLMRAKRPDLFSFARHYAKFNKNVTLVKVVERGKWHFSFSWTTNRTGTPSHHRHQLSFILTRSFKEQPCLLLNLAPISSKTEKQKSWPITHI